MSSRRGGTRLQHSGLGSACLLGGQGDILVDNFFFFLFFWALMMMLSERSRVRLRIGSCRSDWTMRSASQMEREKREGRATFSAPDVGFWDSVIALTRENDMPFIHCKSRRNQI